MQPFWEVVEWIDRHAKELQQVPGLRLWLFKEGVSPDIWDEHNVGGARLDVSLGELCCAYAKEPAEAAISLLMLVACATSEHATLLNGVELGFESQGLSCTIWFTQHLHVDSDAVMDLHEEVAEALMIDGAEAVTFMSVRPHDHSARTAAPMRPVVATDPLPHESLARLQVRACPPSTPASGACS